VEVLKNSHVCDLGKSFVVEIDSATGLYEAFQTLLKHNIVSAPVYDSEAKKYTGFLDIRDLAGFVVFVYDTQQVHDNTALADLIKEGEQQFKTVGTDGISIKYLSRRNRFQPVPNTSSLYEVCEALAAPDIHRVPVVDGTGRVETIISQTTIIKYLHQKVHVVIDSSQDPTVGDLGIGSSPVLSVTQSEKVINTFRKMEKQQKSGIAILDQMGRLVGTTTAKDLRLFIKNPTLQVLEGNIFDFLKMVRQDTLDERNPSISITKDDKLSRAIGLIAATGVHRIFVVDTVHTFQPVAVLSVTDVLKFLIKNNDLTMIFFFFSQL